MAEIIKIVREINSVNASGDVLTNKIGTSAEYVNIDGTTLDQKIDAIETTLGGDLTDIEDRLTAVETLAEGTETTATTTASGLTSLTTRVVAVENRYTDAQIDAKIAAVEIDPATDTEYGTVMLGTDTELDSTDERVYAIGVDGDGKMAVEVPWTDTVPTWSTLTGKPTTFDPSTHTHAISDVTDLQTTLIGLSTRISATVKLPTWDDETYTLSFETDGGATLDVDLPLESLAKDLAYDEDTKELVLTTQDDTEIRIDVSDLVDTYTHPAGNAPSTASGLYKFATDSTSHITSTTAVAKADIVALGIPAQDTVYTLPAAEAEVLGGVMLGDDTVQTVAGEAVSTAAGKSYKIQINAAGQLVVNVPWTDTTYTHPTTHPASIIATTVPDEGKVLMAGDSVNSAAWDNVFIFSDTEPSTLKVGQVWFKTEPIE